MSERLHDQPDSGLVAVRQYLRLGTWVVGRNPEAETATPEPLENSPDERPPRSDGSQNGHRPGFFIERPVIYSGCSNGLFESPQFHEALERARAVGKLIMSQHLTVVSSRSSRRFMAARADQSLLTTVSECRQVADGLSTRLFGHIKDVALFGAKEAPTVSLLLDWVGQQRAERDATQLYGHFALTFNPRDTKPHIAIVKAPDRASGEEMAADLRAILQSPEKPNEVALGDMQVRIVEVRTS